MRDEAAAFGHAQVENANDISMCHLARQDEFLLEATENLRMTGEFRTDHLDGDGAIHFAVPRLIHGSHAAFAEDLQNLVAAGEDVARSKDAFIGSRTLVTGGPFFARRVPLSPG